MNRLHQGVAVFMVGMLTACDIPAKLSPERIPGARTIDGPRARDLFDRGKLFIDARATDSLSMGRIPGSRHLDLAVDFSEETLSDIARKDQSIVFYCNGVGCLRSAIACEQALSWGFNRVQYYRGGFFDWMRRGFPVE